VHEGQVIRRSLFIAGRHPPELFQPVDTPLGPAPLPVHFAVKPGRPAALAALRLPLRSLVFPLRDHVPDPPATEHPPALRIAVAFVQGRLIRPLPRPTARSGHANAIEDRLQLGAFVPLAGRQADRERPPAPVGGEMQLGAQPAATATERLVGRCVFPLFPSPAARPGRGCGALPPRADGRGRSSRRSRPPSRRLPRRRPLRPPGPEAPAPKRPGGASGAAGRGKSSISRTAPACPARGRRCAVPRGYRSGPADDPCIGRPASLWMRAACLSTGPILGQSGQCVS
jgi:hypothetical protein